MLVVKRNVLAKRDADLFVICQRSAVSPGWCSAGWPRGSCRRGGRGVNVQRRSNILDLYTRQAAQLHRSRLKAFSVLLDLPRSALGTAHLRPVRSRCQL